ncbi:unnamed protein product [Prunus armeniaca]
MTELQRASCFCEAFEWAELQFSQSARAGVTVFRGLQWARDCTVNFVEVFHIWRKLKLYLSWFLLNQICNERNLVLNNLLLKSGPWEF